MYQLLSKFAVVGMIIVLMQLKLLKLLKVQGLVQLRFILELDLKVIVVKLIGVLLKK